MTIADGTRIGPYEILSALGAGGMGEVYRAKDTRIDRVVALKVLPEEFFDDSERVRRFEREARLELGGDGGGGEAREAIVALQEFCAGRSVN
jgi:serine/threonine protein kinase